MKKPSDGASPQPRAGAEQVGQLDGGDRAALKDYERPGKIANDQRKGQFGGMPSSNGYTLRASVVPVDASESWFSVKLEVIPDNADVAKRGQAVTFYLHESFDRDVLTRVTDSNGIATLELKAWGAFTVGVAMEDNTMLELDLASLPDAPQAFKNR